ncbi:MAG: response regulator transcription factor [Ignavibacteria bacterium]|nr:response regulator transcription factor [Ignavibacteria bacterium]
MELTKKSAVKTSRAKRSKKEFYKYVIFMGLLLALAIAALKTFEYYYFAYKLRTDIYIALVAVIFLGLGIYLGIRFGKKQNPVNTPLRSVSLPKEMELSAREAEVLRLITAGLTNQEIADKLYLSLNTIKSHTNSIYSKLGVKRRTQAIEIAKQLQIVP